MTHVQKIDELGGECRATPSLCIARMIVHTVNLCPVVFFCVTVSVVPVRIRGWGGVGVGRAGVRRLHHHQHYADGDGSDQRSVRGFPAMSQPESVRRCGRWRSCNHEGPSENGIPTYLRDDGRNFWWGSPAGLSLAYRCEAVSAEEGSCIRRRIRVRLKWEMLDPTSP